MFAERQQRVANVTAFIAFVVELCSTRRTGIRLLFNEFGPLPCQNEALVFTPYRITQWSGANGLAADWANVFVIGFLVLL